MRSAVVHVRTPLYLNAYAMIASNLLTSVLGLIYWGLAARLYPIENLGVTSAIISTMVFVTGVAQLNLRIALIRLVPEAGPKTGRIVWAAYAGSLAATAALSLVVFGFMATTANSTLAIEGLNSPLGVALLTIGAMTWTIFALQDGVMTGLRRTIWVPVENGLYGVLKIVLLMALAVAMPALGILVSWIVPMILAVIVVTVVLAWSWIPAHIQATQDRAFAMGTRSLRRFVAADYVGSLFTLAVTALLPVLIVNFAGPRDGAYFYIVWTISTSMNLLPLNLSASMTVETIHADLDLSVEVRRAGVHMARILVPLVAGVVIFAEWILHIFGPDYVAGGTTALRLLALGVLPYAVTTLYLAAARVRGRGREIMVVQVVAAGVMIAGSLLLLNGWGVTGVAAAWLVSETAVAAVVGFGRLWPLISAGGDAERRARSGA